MKVLLDTCVWGNAADELRAAGLTWEDVLSLVGSKVDKAQLWSALAPSMGYMALLRNLRNMDEAGVSDDVAAAAAAKAAAVFGTVLAPAATRAVRLR